MPDDDRLEAISNALARLIHRQDEMDRRLARIEAAQGVHQPVYTTTPTPVPVVQNIAPPPLPVMQPVMQSATPPIAQYVAPPPVPPPPPKSSATMETLIGLNWINIAGVVTLIFAAMFIFKYAVDNNWVGPGARVALGVVAALLSLFFGDLLWRRRQKVFGQGLTGLGLALLYLSFWASFGLYHLIPQAAAFVLMVVTTCASVVFAMRYESQTIAALGMFAGYLTPASLSSGEPRLWVLFNYVFLLDLGGLALTRFRKWRALEYLAALATFLWYGVWLVGGYHPADQIVAVVFAIAFYALFCCARSKLLWFLAQFFCSAAMPGPFDKSPVVAPFLLIIAAGGLVVSEIRRWATAPAWTLTSFWGFYLIWQAQNTASKPAELLFAWLTIGFLLFFGWILWWGVIAKRDLRKGDLFVVSANAAAYFGASYYLLNPDYHAYMGLLAVALAAANLLLAKLVFKPQDTKAAVMAIAVTLSFLTCAAPIQFAGFRITMAWALEGAALAWLSSRFSSPRLTIGSAFLLALTVMRLLFIDAEYYAGRNDMALLVNARFVTFAVGAASLMIAAKFFADRAVALTSYVAGHFITLLALGLELFAYVRKTVAPENQFQTTTVSISILLAGYALMLVTIGVATKTAINRILGLILLGFVVVKLYLSDVWELSYIFRIIAFLGLGVLLLTVSYLYSRFRPMLEKLWKDES